MVISKAEEQALSTLAAGRALQEIRTLRDYFSPETYDYVCGLLQHESRDETIDGNGNALPQQDDEIRLLTVVFVDIVNSTEHAQRLPEGRWKALLNTIHQRLASVVLQWNGEIGQYLGDGLLCFFGLSHSYVDDASRAVGCALQLISSIRTMDERAGYVPLQIRIGISTGRVVVGLIGHNVKRELLALGSATNLAARLQGQATPGSVIVDMATYARVRDDFVIEAHEPVQLKGYDQPVVFYEVSKRRYRPFTELTSPLLIGQETEFIGHVSTLRHMTDISRTAHDQSIAQGLMIHGDVGTGKSRLLQEFVRLNLRMQDAPAVFVIQGKREVITEPLSLMKNMLYRLIESSVEGLTPQNEDSLRRYLEFVWPVDYAEKGAAVFASLMGLADSEELQSVYTNYSTPEARLSAAIEWSVQLIDAIVQDQHMVMVVDDVQWADSLSVQWLLQLMQHYARSPVSFFLSTSTRHFNSQIRVFSRAIAFDTVQLGPLNALAQIELVESLLRPVTIIPDSLVALITERSQGNPMFIVELIKMFFDLEVLQPISENEWRFDPMRYEHAIPNLPQSLLGVLQSRIDDLPDEARYLLQLASIIGRDFWKQTLDHLFQRDSGMWIRMLIDRGLVREDEMITTLLQTSELILPEDQTSDEMSQGYRARSGDEQFHFVQPYYQEVAYGMLPVQKRLELHQSVATWYESIIAVQPSYFPQYIWQLIAAGEYLRTLQGFLQLLKLRIIRDFSTNVLRMLPRIIEVADNLPAEQANPYLAQIWYHVGLMYTFQSEHTEAIEALTQGLNLFSLDLAHNAGEVVEIQRMLALIYTRQGNFDAAYDYLTQAYDTLGETGGGEDAAILQVLGLLHYYRGQLRDAETYQLRAMDQAYESGQPERIAAVQSQLAVIEHERGRSGAALSYLHEVHNAKNDTVNRYHILDLRQLAQIYYDLHAYQPAKLLIQRAIEASRIIGWYDALTHAYDALLDVALYQNHDAAARLEQMRRQLYDDIYISRSIYWVFLRGLVHLKKWNELLRHSVEFYERAGENPLLIGRGLYMIGSAKSRLGHGDAAGIIDSALQHEQEYAGLYTWSAAYQLAALTTDPGQRQAYLDIALPSIRNQMSTLNTFPEVHRAYTQYIRRLRLLQTPLDS